MKHPARVLIVLLCASLAMAQTPIGFIGDSITHGYPSPYTTSPPAEMILVLGGSYSVVNRGTDGATTANWIGGTVPMAQATAAFASAGVTKVYIMLGTNDAGNNVTSATYQSNMSNIIGALRGGGYDVILNSPPAMTCNAFGYIAATSNVLIQQYVATFAALVAAYPGHVSIGDTTAFSVFQADPTLIRDCVHPTDHGYAVLGGLWAAGFRRLFFSGTGGSAVSGAVATSGKVTIQ